MFNFFKPNKMNQTDYFVKDEADFNKNYRALSGCVFYRQHEEQKGKVEVRVVMDKAHSRRILNAIKD